MPQKHREDRAGKVSLVLRIDLNSKPAAYDKCGEKAYKILPEYWDPKKREVISSHPNAALINLALRKRALELEGIFMLKEAAGLKLNKERIKALVAGKDPGISFCTFCRTQISEKYDNKETIRTYLSELTKLEHYRENPSFADIDFAFLQSYGAHMRDVLHNAPNTIWKTFKFLNTMMRDAIKVGGIIDSNPFDQFNRGTYKQTARTFLTATERGKLEKVLSMGLPEDLLKVAIYQLFMCYAGLRFEDAMAFDYGEHIIEDSRLVMVTQKADEMINIKLYPKLREILTFVREYPLRISNKEYNEKLRIVSVLAGIDKHTTAHVGRHSFGRMLAENGVDIKKAQKLLGHKDERSTRIYYHLLDTDVDKEVDDKLGGI